MFKMMGVKLIEILHSKISFSGICQNLMSWLQWLFIHQIVYGRKSEQKCYGVIQPKENHLENLGITCGNKVHLSRSLRFTTI